MELLEQFILIGANRRSDKTVIEFWLELSEEEAKLLEASGAALGQRLVQRLVQSGIDVEPGHPLRQALMGSPAERYGRLVGGVSLALQQHADHRVKFLGSWPGKQANRCFAAFEYEHNDTGIDACQLAMHLLSELEPGIALPEEMIEGYRGFEHHLRSFIEDARRHVLPRDAQAIIDAAQRLDIPCVKLDREPYEGVQGEFRIRPNGMLKLGHACYQRVIDGTFPIDEDHAPAGLLRDREAIVRALAALGLPCPRRDAGTGLAVSARRAVRAAERIGFPVVLKPRLISRGADSQTATGLSDAAGVQAAAERLLRTSAGVMVEACVPGKTFKLIVADGEVVAVVELDDGVAVREVTATTDASILALARSAARRLKAAVLTLTIVSRDTSQPLSAEGAVVSLDVAPALDRFLGELAAFPACGILDLAAERLVRRLFPPGTAARIPLVSVTGTNGKTTVSGLIERVMQRNGWLTARAGTTGFFVDGECIKRGDMSGGTGHNLVLECADASFGILETARGAAITTGLMFDACDVSVCTNVTVDHLGQMGFDRLEQMADLKEFIVQRARRAVVLNADNEWSIGMLPRLQGRRAWICSITQSAETLRARYGEEPGLGVVEPAGDAEWLVLYDGRNRIPLMAAAEMPITFGGQIRYNLENALQAAAVCCQMGAPAETIRNVFAAFTPTFEDNPARMNFYEGLPFRVLYDYAHNEDGYRYLAEFVDTLKVEGRKIIVYSGVSRNEDAAVARAVSPVAGFFDLYICHNISTLWGRQPEEVPAIMKKALMDKGVPEGSIIEMPGEDWPEETLRLCRPGDLLVFCSTTRHMDSHWELIKSWGQDVRDGPDPA